MKLAEIKEIFHNCGNRRQTSLKKLEPSKRKVTQRGKLASGHNVVSGVLLMPRSGEGSENPRGESVGPRAAQREEVSEAILATRPQEGERVSAWQGGPQSRAGPQLGGFSF